MIRTFFHWQKPDLAGLQEFLKPLNKVILKASALTEGRRSEFFNHLKTVADSLTALAWVAYSGKDCGQYSTNFYGIFFFPSGCIVEEFLPLYLASSQA